MMQTDTLKKIDASRCLPHGEQLRVLLSGDHITYGEVASLARKKGFFSYNSDKSKTIPVLATSLLRPFELVDLLEKSTSREQVKKAKNDAIDLVSADADWQSSLKNFEPQLKNLLKNINMPGVKVTQAPEIKFTGKNNAVIRYKINRLDYSKDLLGRDLDFEAEITIQQENGKLNLGLVGFHTSKETYKLNEQIFNSLGKHFKSEDISPTGKTNKVLFNNFTNKNRITFLLRLAGGFQNPSTPGLIIDCNIRRNEDESIPDNEIEIKWLDSTVKNMAIDGESLNKVIELTSVKYFNYFFITRITVKHEFTIGANGGSCIGIYSFQRSRSQDNLEKAEFTYHIENLQIQEKQNLVAKNKVRDEIFSLIRKKVEHEHTQLAEKPTDKTSTVTAPVPASDIA